MPVKKVKGGWKAGSYVTKGKWFKRLYKTKAAAERRAKTSGRRSKRTKKELNFLKRHTGRRY